MSSFNEITKLAKIALGLNEKQARVYAICAKEGFLNPSQISRLVNIKRTTVYLELQELKDKGLLVEKIKGKRRLIGVVESQALHELINQEKEKLVEKESHIEKMVSLMENMKKVNGDETDIEILDGKNGTITLIEKIIKQQENIYWFGSLESILKVISDEKLYKLMTWRRMDQKTISYAITDRRILENKRFGEKIEGFRQFRFLPKIFETQALFVIFGKNTALVRVENEKIKIILIQDSKIQMLIKYMFENLWDLLPSQ